MRPVVVVPNLLRGTNRQGGVWVVLAVLVAAALAASLLLLMMMASPARADTTFTVKSSADTDGSTCGAADCTLRQAINAANAASGNDTIVFNVGQTATTITLGSRLPAITDASGLTIDGGSASITVSGNKQVGVLGVGGFSGRLALKNLTVADGFVTGSQAGGGLYNDGTLEVTDSTFSGNSAPVGAAIATGNQGTLTVTNSTFSDNSADLQGGGIYNLRGALTVINSTFSGNSAIQGSGIYSDRGALTVTNSTISQNIMRSHDQAHGGGIYSTTGGSLKNTIVANNSGENCFGPLTDGGYNIDDGTTCGFSTTNNSQPSTNPLLDSAGLKDNGGPTKTIALQEGSPAIDKGNSFGFTTDQRSVSRPQGVAADIGAFEVDKNPTVTQVSPLENATKVSRSTNVTATFSEEVQQATLTTANVQLFSGNSKKPVKATLSKTSTSVTLTPSSKLDANTTYRAVVGTGVTDLAGNALDQDQNPNNGNQPKQWTFTTGPK